MSVISIQVAFRLLLTLISIYIIRLWLNLRKLRRLHQDRYGLQHFVHPSSYWTGLFPELPFINPGAGRFAAKYKHEPFAQVGCDVYTQYAIFPKAQSSIIVADADVVKEIVSQRSKFPKPVRNYEILSVYGDNIVASEDEQWKRYRRITAPAFSDRNNRLVWSETVKVMENLFEKKWGGQDEVVVDHCVDITLPIALFVIGAAGFGRNIDWDADNVAPPGHRMTFKDALHLVAGEIVLKVIVPPVLMGLTHRLRNVKIAFKELETYMHEMIKDRRAAASDGERDDLFTSLLQANESGFDGRDAPLLDSEVLGNIFVFLIAGHETTAHTLCYTFALLAMFPDKQEKLYKHIKSVIPNDCLPTYEEMPLFTYSMAVFYETLRMFSPVWSIPKESAEDTVFSSSNSSGEKIPIAVPKGTIISLCPPGLHYNPKYWEDPHSFQPERFLKDWPRDAFLPFSAGPRACLGKKFFETEGIAVLTMLVARYHIEIKPEPEFASETFEERWARVFRTKAGLTLTPIRVPLVFKRRV